MHPMVVNRNECESTRSEAHIEMKQKATCEDEMVKEKKRGVDTCVRSEKDKEPCVELRIVVAKSRGEFFETADVKARTSGTALAVYVEGEAVLDSPPRSCTAYRLLPHLNASPTTVSKEEVNMMCISTPVRRKQREE